MAKRYKDRPPTHKRHEVCNCSSRNLAPIRGIAVHTTESSDLPRTDDDLDGVQAWFDNPKSQASSWIGVDGDGHSRLWVPGAKKAWTMGHYEINACTLNIEFVGRAKQPASAWETAQLKAGAKWSAFAILNYRRCEIPVPVRRGEIQLRTGQPNIVKCGILRHKDLTDVGIGSHTDPGPGFPMGEFIDLVNYYIENGWTLGITR
jgi:N-acetyl-anhydromuramyl-L-alanine amidase AmpD